MSQSERKNSVRNGKKKKEWDCPYCNKSFPDAQDSLQCDTCENWVCLSCTGIPVEMYKLMSQLSSTGASQDNNGLKWICRLCDRSLPTLKDMNNTLGSLMKTNNERFDAIENQVTNLENSIGDKVSEEVTNMKDKLTKDISDEIDSRLTAKLKEESEKRFREMNLCFFNVPVSKDSEPAERKRHDEEIVSQLYQAIVKGDNVTKPQLKNVFRLRSKTAEEKQSKHLPVLKATFVQKSDIRNFLSYARDIPGNPKISKELQKIMVSKDLSVTEREQNRKLRHELVEKNKEGAFYTIRNGKIVPKVARNPQGATGTSSPSE